MILLINPHLPAESPWGLSKMFPNEKFVERKISLNFYAAMTLATLGVGAIYWFYKIFNEYNNHFKAQWKIEDRIVELLEKGKTS